MPAYSLLQSRARLAAYLQPMQNAPLPRLGPKADTVREFGGLLEPRYIIGARPLDQ
jgi:hypothetical protein